MKSELGTLMNIISLRGGAALYNECVHATRSLGGNFSKQNSKFLLIVFFSLMPRVRKTLSARQQCRPESFCESGKFLQQAYYLLENFRIFWKMSGYYTKYPDNMQSRDELEIFHMM